MRRLPFLFFAAAIAIWGLASIPDGSSGEKSLQVSGVRTGGRASTRTIGRNPSQCVLDVKGCAFVPARSAP